MQCLSDILSSVRHGEGKGELSDVQEDKGYDVIWPS